MNDERSKKNRSVLADIESFFHRLRRRFDRSERTIRKLGLSVSQDSGERPGLLLIQIGNLTREGLERALKDGHLPFFARLREREKYQLYTFDSQGEPMTKVLREFCDARTDTLLSPDCARIDLVRGLPVVCANLQGSGELSSHDGRSLRSIDAAARALTIEAHRSQRRDYHVWLFSARESGLLLVPPGTWLPADSDSIVRPAALREAAQALLERRPAKHAMPGPLSPPEMLSVMSYNVHSCIGMDGRVSPRRIARAIAREGSDIVALQEVDHGRARSRAEDQASDIAAELGFHFLFCPAVVRGHERYGHALLSRWPLETVKVDFLPSHPGGVWPEPRAALWARVLVPDGTVNVLSTHLGLSAPERMKQMTAILGSEWLGPILDHELVILCGDFNLTPGSAAHRLAASRLRDVAHNFKRGVHTFSSIRLVAQLDHIFVSPHFGLESVFAAQNDLTRVASDHLPLVAHLRMPGK